METKEVILEFGKEMKRGYKKAGKENEVRILVKNLLDETKKGSLDFMYYVNMAQLETGVVAPDEALQMIVGESTELRQIFIAGLMSE